MKNQGNHNGERKQRLQNFIEKFFFMIKFTILKEIFLIRYSKKKFQVSSLKCQLWD
ncbi:hypothetical protein pb186bvf_012107 [Paramecium bursaria]